MTAEMTAVSRTERGAGAPGAPGSGRGSGGGGGGSFGGGGWGRGNGQEASPAMKAATKKVDDIQKKLSGYPKCAPAPSPAHIHLFIQIGFSRCVLLFSLPCCTCI